MWSRRGARQDSDRGDIKSRTDDPGAEDRNIEDQREGGSQVQPEVEAQKVGWFGEGANDELEHKEAQTHTGETVQCLICVLCERECPQVVTEEREHRGDEDGELDDRVRNELGQRFQALYVRPLPLRLILKPFHAFV